ncbi:MAG: HU family DNA-binding protein [Microcoleaceae cyanobacterium]
MKKQELIQKITAEVDVPKPKVKAVVDKVFEIVSEEIAKGEPVSVPGLGRFTTQERPATTRTNPETGETVEVPAKQVVKFKPGKAKEESVEEVNLG